MCEYCDPNNEKCIIYTDVVRRFSYLITDEEERLFTTIKYCPYCGRRL